jgi:hypothetical protein
MKVLLEIRDAVRETNARLERCTQRLDHRNDPASTFPTRLAVETGALREARRELTAEVRDWEDREISRRLDDHEQRLRALERRTG